MRLSLKLLGGFAILDSSGAELRIRLRKTRALLAYLACHPDTPQPRERLMALLWSNRDDQQARQSLNDALVSIRRLCDGDSEKLINSDSEQVTLRSATLQTDVAQFQALLHDDPLAAANLYVGPFLDGLSISDPGFEDWLGTTRSALESEACDALLRAANAAIRKSDTGLAVELARRLVALDPLREDAHRLLMRLLYERGDRVGALRQYQICADTLQHQLQIEPDASTKALFDEIKQDEADSRIRSADESVEQPKDEEAPSPISRTAMRRWFVPVVAASVVFVFGAGAIVWIAPWAPLAEPAAQYCTTLASKPSIAVLPFKNLSDDGKENYLSEGITDDIITRLARRPDMIVTARTSSAAVVNKSLTVPEIGRKLGVAYILEGSVQKSGNRMRITNQLIETETGSHLWAERYDRDVKDVFAMQDEIAHRVATELASELTAGEKARINFKSTDNFQAYDHFLRGMDFYDKRSKRNHETARTLFEKAIELDPQFARAIAMLGRVYVARRYHGYWGYDPEQSLKRAEELAHRALAIDEDLAIGHGLLGWIYVWRGEYEQAIVEAKRARALDPNSYGPLTWMFLFAGRSKEATEVITRARCLSPYPTNGMLTTEAQTHYLSGRYEATIATSRELIARKGRISVSRKRITASYMALGREQEARAEAKLHNEEFMKLRGKPYQLKLRIKTLKSRPWKDKSWIDVYAERLRQAGIPE